MKKTMFNNNDNMLLLAIDSRQIIRWHFWQTIIFRHLFYYLSFKYYFKILFFICFLKVIALKSNVSVLNRDKFYFFFTLIDTKVDKNQFIHIGNTCYKQLLSHLDNFMRIFCELKYSAIFNRLDRAVKWK